MYKPFLILYTFDTWNMQTFEISERHSHALLIFPIFVAPAEQSARDQFVRHMFVRLYVRPCFYWRHMHFGDYWFLFGF